MRSPDDKENQSKAAAPDATRRRLIKGSATLPFVASLAPSSNLAAQSATCDSGSGNAAGSCMTSVDGNALNRRGGPEFGSYT